MQHFASSRASIGLDSFGFWNVCLSLVEDFFIHFASLSNLSALHRLSLNSIRLNPLDTPWIMDVLPLSPHRVINIWLNHNWLQISTAKPNQNFRSIQQMWINSAHHRAFDEFLNEIRVNHGPEADEWLKFHSPRNSQGPCRVRLEAMLIYVHSFSLSSLRSPFSGRPFSDFDCLRRHDGWEMKWKENKPEELWFLFRTKPRRTVGANSSRPQKCQSKYFFSSSEFHFWSIWLVSK